VATYSVADFLLPEGYAAPRAAAVLREASVVTEAGRLAWSRLGRRVPGYQPYAGHGVVRDVDPVVLVPGFLAGDASLALMARALREHGHRTYRAHIRANVGCTLQAAEQLESRIESVVARRGRRVRIVGHSLGGMLARGLAVRRPDLVAGIVTLGSPMLAPGAHHATLTRSLDALVRLSRAGVPGLHRRRLCPGQLRREPRSAAARRGVHRDLLPARRHRRLACVHRSARHGRGGALVAPRDGGGPLRGPRGAPGAVGAPDAAQITE